MILVLSIALSFPCLAALSDKSYWSTGMLDLGNKAYEAGDFDSAIACYSKIIANGVESPTVYYNLGNACFRKGRFGYAILYYEKAKRFAPEDEDIGANLRFVKSRLTDKIPEPQISFFGKVVQKLLNLFSLQAATVITSLLLFLVCLLAIAGIFSRFTAKLTALYAGIFFLVVFLGSAASLAYRIHQYETLRHVVALSPSVDALNEPGGNQVLFTVHEGVKFQIRQRMEDWFLVSLPNGMAGWVASKDVGEI